jgi:hypothetical protein
MLALRRPLMIADPVAQVFAGGGCVEETGEADPDDQRYRGPELERDVVAPPEKVSDAHSTP